MVYTHFGACQSLIPVGTQQVALSSVVVDEWLHGNSGLREGKGKDHTRKLVIASEISCVLSSRRCLLCFVRVFFFVLIYRDLVNTIFVIPVV